MSCISQANRFFPGGGFCSVLTVLQGGDMVEVATIGHEGMVGASAVLKAVTCKV
jgi:hypothetical protein